MKKNSQHQDFGKIRLENGNPKCMYNIFDVLQRHRWYRVKKMLTNKRHSSGKHALDPGTSQHCTDACPLEEPIDSVTGDLPIEEQRIEPNPISKPSKRYRIRSLFSEEMSKRKGKHRRSTSYPTRLPLQRSNSNSTHHTRSPDLVSNPEIAARGKTSTYFQESNDASSSITKKKRCELCVALLALSQLRQTRVLDEHGNQTIYEETKKKKKIFPKDPNLLQDMDQVLDSLDISDIREEGLLKLLQDIHSLHSHMQINPDIGLTRSVSFPVLGSSRERALKLEELKCQLQDCKEIRKDGLPLPMHRCNDNGVSKPMLTRPESFKNPSSSQKGNKPAINRFKNLRQKIGHIIKESKKERHRIILDSVFHKIPYGRKAYKDTNNDPDKLRKSSPSFKADQSTSEKKCLTRTSSLNEALCKYSHLLDYMLIREEKTQNSDRLKMKLTEMPSPRQSKRQVLKRILSLPNLSSSSFMPNDGPLVKTSMDIFPSLGCRKIDNQTAPGHLVIGEKKSECSVNRESVGEESTVETDEIPDEKLEMDLSALDHQEKIEQKLDIATEVDNLAPDLLLDSSSHMDLSISLQEPELEDVSSAKLQHKLSTDSLGRNMAQVDDQKKEQRFRHLELESVKDNPEFCYVKDVLERSGFSGEELLGAWHSNYQPMDPLFFEELETSLNHPDNVDNISSSEDEEGTHKLINSNHHLLFDLINEVLLEIYDRTFSYCPRRLTWCSDIHPMPVGSHVLEEVWAIINLYLRWKPKLEQSLDAAVSQDLARKDGWMNLHYDAEFVGLELEEMIFDDLLDELVLD